MDRYWETQKRKRPRSGLIFLGLALLWVLISMGLNRMEKTGCVFELLPVLECKLLALALIYAGRYLLFPHYRMERLGRWVFSILLLVLSGAGLIRVGKLFEWSYAGLVVVDTLLWVLLSTVLVETCAALTGYWIRTFRGLDYGNIIDLWKGLWLDGVKLGIWITLLCGLTFFYMVNFYELDVFFYSRFFTALFWMTQLGLLTIGCWNSRRILYNEILRIDRELTAYLKWRALDSEAFAEFLPRYQYLYVTRCVLANLASPAVPLSALTVWLLCCGSLLGLPYLIGSVVQL